MSATGTSQAAFVNRLDEHRGILFKVANAYCRDRAAREDLVQETILQLWRAYPRFREGANFSTWMYRIAVNVAISFHRTQTRRTRSVEFAEPAILETLPAPPEEEAPDERLAALREFVDRLDELNRALMLLYLDDRPYAEIAAILGITETNVATKINRIKHRLRRMAWNSTN